MTESEIPKANDADDGDRLFRFSFGAYAETKVDVYANSADSAFETAVEWLDDHAPGHLESIGEAELQVAAREIGCPWPSTNWTEWADEEPELFAKVVAHAETDLTSISHTTLDHGQYLCSWEWTFLEISG